MQLVSVHDPAALRAFLSQDRGRFAYSLGDLDPFFWESTLWYGARDAAQRLRAVIMLYLAPRRPCALVFGEELEALGWLLEALAGHLPPRFDLHVERELLAVAQARWRLEHVTPFCRMILRRPVEAAAPVAWLTEADLPAIQALYAASYPDNAFDPRMLATGRYAGWRGADGGLEAIAGVHVYAPGEGVAALGNITTLPARRGAGLGARVTAAVCARLQREGLETVVLNVREDNAPAIRLYERLGFELQLRYVEAVAQGISAPAPPP